MTLSTMPGASFPNTPLKEDNPFDSNAGQSLRSVLQRLLALHYESSVLFLEGQHKFIQDVSSFTVRSSKLAEWVSRLNPPPACMKVARRFPGLLSVCDAKRACPCPLHGLCGVSRVDIIRLESHREVLGVLMLLADTSTPLHRQDAEKVETAVRELSRILWSSLRIGVFHDSMRLT